VDGRTAEPSVPETPIRVAVELRAPLPEDLAPELERRLLFISPSITGFELLRRGGNVSGVLVTSDGEITSKELARKVDTVVDQEVRGQLTTAAKRVWASPHRFAGDCDVFAELVRDGAVEEAGEGQVVLAEPLLSLLRWFDRAACAVLTDVFEAREFRYPTLISAAALRSAGYPASFPQHLMLVTRLHNDIDIYRKYLEHLASDPDDSAAVLGLCRNLDYCLPPTMCFHTFHQHRGRTLEPGRLHVVTSRGKSFRYEAGYAATLERLWDFTIREVVFLGGRDEVLAARTTYQEEFLGLIESLGLSGCCELANDPFFGRLDSHVRASSQRMLEMKFELRLDVSPHRDIAVGSFNFHDDLFGRAFTIGYDGSPAYSACVGIGLERLVYAFLCQYGTDRREWPEAVRSGIRGAGASD
jgi:hypothetical protein